MVAPVAQAAPAHPCEPPPDRIGRWTCRVCGSGWRSVSRREGAPAWVLWPDADSVPLSIAWSLERDAAALPWWAWWRRSATRGAARLARADAGRSW